MKRPSFLSEPRPTDEKEPVTMGARTNMMMALCLACAAFACLAVNPVVGLDDLITGADDHLDVFIEPGLKPECPNRDACESPMSDVIGMPSGSPVT